VAYLIRLGFLAQSGTKQRDRRSRSRRGIVHEEDTSNTHAPLRPGRVLTRHFFAALALDPELLFFPDFSLALASVKAAANSSSSGSSPGANSSGLSGA